MVAKLNRKKCTYLLSVFGITTLSFLVVEAVPVAQPVSKSSIGSMFTSVEFVISLNQCSISNHVMNVEFEMLCFCYWFSNVEILWKKIEKSCFEELVPKMTLSYLEVFSHCLEGVCFVVVERVCSLRDGMSPSRQV